MHLWKGKPVEMRVKTKWNIIQEGIKKGRKTQQLSAHCLTLEAGVSHLSVLPSAPLPAERPGGEAPQGDVHRGLPGIASLCSQCLSLRHILLGFDRLSETPQLMKQIHTITRNSNVARLKKISRFMGCKVEKSMVDGILDFYHQQSIPSMLSST